MEKLSREDERILSILSSIPNEAFIPSDEDARKIIRANKAAENSKGTKMCIGIPMVEKIRRGYPKRRVCC